MLKFSENCDLSINFRDLILLESKKSEYHNIKIYCHKILGKILVLNNEVQHVEKWAHLYHEMVVHYPASFIPNLEEVLILGGGSLFAAKEVLKYPSVKKLNLIDIDKEVTNLISKVYPHAKKVLKDSRFKLITDNAFEYLKYSNFKYDLIINDAIDLLDIYKTKNSNFYNFICSRIKHNGICSDVIYRSIFEKHSTIRTINKLNNNKLESSFSLITVPDYPGIFHVLCLWSKSNVFLRNKSIANPLQLDFINGKSKIFFRCKFYNPRFLNFYSYLPTYIKTYLK